MDLTKLSWAPATQFHACCPRPPPRHHFRSKSGSGLLFRRQWAPCVTGVLGAGPANIREHRARLYDKKAGGERSSHLGIRTRATRSTMLLIVHQRRICSNTTTCGSGIQRFEQEILFSCTFMKTFYNSCYMQKRISTNLQALHLLSLNGKGFCD